MLLRFKDSRGTEWEVWEVGARAMLADVALQGHDVNALPARWLCFASATERRRLTGYPQRWAAMRPAELEALCQTATPRQAGFRGVPVTDDLTPPTG